MRGIRSHKNRYNHDTGIITLVSYVIGFLSPDMRPPTTPHVPHTFFISPNVNVAQHSNNFSQVHSPSHLIPNLFQPLIPKSQPSIVSHATSVKSVRCNEQQHIHNALDQIYSPTTALLASSNLGTTPVHNLNCLTPYTHNHKPVSLVDYLITP